MIRLDNIDKQNSHQILFIDASMGLQKGEKAGLDMRRRRFVGERRDDRRRVELVRQ